LQYSFSGIAIATLLLARVARLPSALARLEQCERIEPQPRLTIHQCKEC
jgi:hypothetical protein